jgi:hypothetical protein
MISNTYANKILNHLCGMPESLGQPDALYLGLCSEEPAATNGAVTGQPDAPSYARVIVGGRNYTNHFDGADQGKITNSKEIQFKTARTAWGEMKYFFLSTSATGNAIMWGEINNGNGVTIGDETVPTFYEGELTISLDVPLAE